jgi:hypothetical protein
MSDSPMVIMWPSRRDDTDTDGYYASVTLSQRKAPYETMPTPDPDPPFVATLELAETSACPFILSLKKKKGSIYARSTLLSRVFETLVVY